MTWLIYFAGVVGDFKTLLLTVGGIVGVAAAVLFALSIDEDAISISRSWRKIFIASMICITTGVLIPSGGTIAAMVVIPRVAQNSDIAGVSENTLKGLNAMAEKWAAEKISELDVLKSKHAGKK